MDWFRSHHGAPIDPKLAVVAKRASCRRGDAAAVWWCILDCASQNVTRGDASNFDIEAFAVTLEFDIDLVERIVKSMQDKGMLVDGMRVANWEKRQVRREDSSTERTRRWRDAQKRTVTHGDDREEEIEEKEIKKKAARKRADDIPEGFNEFWEAYPRKAAKPAGMKAYRRALSRGAKSEAILAGLATYKRTKPDYADWAHPATWLNNDRWNDEPQTPAERTVAAALDSGLLPQRSRPWRVIVDGFRRTGFWPDGMGPRPGRDGCEAPDELLTTDEIAAKRKAA